MLPILFAEGIWRFVSMWNDSLLRHLSLPRTECFRPRFGAIPENEFLERTAQSSGEASAFKNLSNLYFFYFFRIFCLFWLRKKLTFLFPWTTLYYFNSFLLFDVTVFLWPFYFKGFDTVLFLVYFWMNLFYLLSWGLKCLLDSS